ncbi:response regulator [bacterium]|nr:response regulator [bacterium]
MQQIRDSKVLIVDDEQEAVDLMSTFLEQNGVVVFKAYNGESGLELVQKEKPDIVILDLQMPKMNGFEVSKAIKSKNETRLIPIIMLTGNSDFDARISGLESGVDDFMTKPYNFKELLFKVRNLVNLKKYTDELENAESVIFSLAMAVEARDDYTEGHCTRLAYYGELLGRHLNLPEEQVRAIIQGAYLHDIGKIGISDNILLKKGKLTDEEWEIMKKHPEIGENICKPLKSLRFALPVIRHHQERFNGSGYPDKLKGAEIPFNARLIAVVDFFDALSTHRPYRAALPADECIKIMIEETLQGYWDPFLINEFFKVLKQIKETQITLKDEDYIDFCLTNKII